MCVWCGGGGEGRGGVLIGFVFRSLGLGHEGGALRFLWVGGFGIFRFKVVCVVVVVVWGLFGCLTASWRKGCGVRFHG